MTVLDLQVSVGADDVSGHSFSWSATAAFHTLGKISFFGTQSSIAGYRFTGTNGIGGTTIDVAYIELFPYVRNNNPVTIIRADDAEAPTAPTNYSTHGGKTRTTAGVSWDVSGGVNQWVQSPSIVSVIQELADDYDPSEIQILQDDNGSPSATDNVSIRSYEYDTTLAPRLYIEYTASTSAVEFSATMAATSTMQASTTAASLITATMATSSTATANVTASSTITVTMASVSTMDALVRRPIAFEATMAAVATMSASLVPAAYIVATMTSWSTMQATVIRRANVPAAVMAATATMETLLRTPVHITATMAATSSMDARPAIVPEITATMAATSSMDATLTAIKDMIVRMSARSTMQAELLQFVPVTGYGLRIDIHDPSGAKLGPGPVVNIFNARYSSALSEVGRFSFTMSATDPMGEYIQSGHEARIYRDGEGLVYRGIIDRSEITIDDSGQIGLTVTGDSIARQLVWVNTLLGLAFSNTAMSSAVSTLLSGTGWTAQSVQPDSRNVTASFEGASIWQALVTIAEIFGWHVRERNMTRQIDVGKLGTASGLIARNVQAIEPDSRVLPLGSLRIQDAHSELWNRVIPVGGGEGVNVLTLRYSDRTSPYTIQTATGPSGTYWYLQDDASVAAHGLRVKVISVDDVVPLSNSVAEIRNAANTLYDIASAWLGWHSQQQETYEASVLGLRHVEGGNTTFRVGNTMRVTYTGVVDDEQGRRVWRALDKDLWILGYERTFHPDGRDDWSFTLSTTDQKAPDAATAIAKAVDDVWAIKTAKKPYSYSQPHYTVESVASGQNARLLVDFDDTITYLHRAVLRVRKRRVKSNVSGAAAGGGQTSSSGGGQTTSSGGGQTSSGGGSHSHSISAAVTPSGGGHTSSAGDSHTHTVTGGTAVGSGAHHHVLGVMSSVTGWSSPGYRQTYTGFYSNNGNPTSFGYIVGRDGTSLGGVTMVTGSVATHTHSLTGIANASESSHRHGILNHTHSVSGQTAAAVSDHTHSVQNHTHTVQNHTHEIQDHTHALIYGIFLGPTASTPQFNVLINGTNRTTALAGPWNNDFTVDISEYLTDSLGQPLRQANNIDISSSQLCDVEILVRSFVSSHSIVPV